LRTAELGKEEAVGELARTTSKLDDAVRDRRLLQATVASVQMENNRLKVETAQAVAAAAKANKNTVEANRNLQGEVQPLLARAHTQARAFSQLTTRTQRVRRGDYLRWQSTHAALSKEKVTHTHTRTQALTHTHTHQEGLEAKLHDAVGHRRGAQASLASAEQTTRAATSKANKLEAKVNALRREKEVRRVSGRELRNANARVDELSAEVQRLTAVPNKAEELRAGLEVEMEDAAREMDELESQVLRPPPTHPLTHPLLTILDGGSECRPRGRATSQVGRSGKSHFDVGWIPRRAAGFFRG
jgi:hypothetical protein